VKLDWPAFLGHEKNFTVFMKKISHPKGIDERAWHKCPL
jgi:hypothetical protein